MNYKDYDIKQSYISHGEKNIADDLVRPLLKSTLVYKRSVGFFSSGVLEVVFNEVMNLARNNGKIQLICSPKLSSRDIEAINVGYAERERTIEGRFSNEFTEVLADLEDEKLQLLAELVAYDVLDIKIAVTDTVGEYHDKLGIMEDSDKNVVVFFGSANSSLNGYRNNYEKIRVFKSWIQGHKPIIEDEIAEFNALWNDTNKYVKSYHYTESAKKQILEVIENRKQSKKQNGTVDLRDYQKKAINAWVENKYHGFYVMATGTGKTWTAIYSIKKLLEKHKAFPVICAPYKHLVKQWAEDVEKAFPDAKIILVSSENPKWEAELSEEIIRCKYNPNNQIIVISTIVSFCLERFINTISKYTGEKVLVVDEAHRFKMRDPALKDDYKYMLGLSATPYSGKSTEQGDKLMDFFGGRVCDLPIEKVIGKYLVNYNYYPVFVNATQEDENQFKYYTKKMASCYKNGVLYDPESLARYYRARLRTISMAQEKIARIDELISAVKEKDHFIVYCGDGKLFGGNEDDEIRHIQFVKNVLNDHGYKPSQFTAKENMYQRMELVDAFNKGEISALVAIRCLDEGINIPSIKSALILSSNDDYREFVQRRGRILRQFGDKKVANIYDVIVLPSVDMTPFATIELRRYLEYARLALNKDALFADLNTYLDTYGLTIEEIEMFDEDKEDDIDE